LWAIAVTIVIATKALGGSVHWAVWLILVANGAGVVISFLGPMRRRAQRYLAITQMILSVVACIGLVLTRR
jgi:hypothetical protein